MPPVLIPCGITGNAKTPGTLEILPKESPHYFNSVSISFIPMFQ